MPKTEEEWIGTSEEFGRRWNFPNCIGAMDGKHVEIKKPIDSGSYYFNYKKKFSIVLFAIVNANYEFIMVEVGANGRVSDAGVLSNSKFFEKFNSKELNIPASGQLTNFSGNMPFTFVGDDAFPLLPNLMKPYGGEKLSNKERVFNYRLSRARRIVENAFGILASRFRILLNIINLDPRKASIVTLATCHLHNFLRKENSAAYLTGSVDFENISTGEIQSGSWRSDAQHLCELQPTCARNPSNNAKEIRRKFTDYFNGEGAVTWQ